MRKNRNYLKIGTEITVPERSSKKWEIIRLDQKEGKPSKVLKSGDEKTFLAEKNQSELAKLGR